MLVRTIIAQALAEIGSYAQGESVSAADYQFALTRFQVQMDAWNALQLALATNQRTTFTLTSGTSTVTIGQSGTPTVNAVRPTFWTAINYVVPGSSPPVEVPMGEMDDDSYAALSIKTLSSSLPQQWYWNATTPNGTLFFWPTPSQNVTIALYYRTANTLPVTLDDDLVGPPGYLEAFIYELAKRLCIPFGRAIPDGLPQLAAEAFSRMQRVNLDPGLLGVDAALVPSFGGAYNVIADGYSGQSGR